MRVYERTEHKFVQMFRRSKAPATPAATAAKKNTSASSSTSTSASSASASASSSTSAPSDRSSSLYSSLAPARRNQRTVAAPVPASASAWSKATTTMTDLLARHEADGDSHEHEQGPDGLFPNYMFRSSKKLKAKGDPASATELMRAYVSVCTSTPRPVDAPSGGQVSMVTEPDFGSDMFEYVTQTDNTKEMIGRMAGLLQLVVKKTEVLEVHVCTFNMVYLVQAYTLY